jgi:hypothetical protein
MSATAIAIRQATTTVPQKREVGFMERKNVMATFASVHTFRTEEHSMAAATPWAILLTKSADKPDEPNSRGFYERLFTSAGTGTFNMTDLTATVWLPRRAPKRPQMGWTSLAFTAPSS